VALSPVKMESRMFGICSFLYGPVFRFGPLDSSTRELVGIINLCSEDHHSWCYHGRSVYMKTNQNVGDHV